MLLSEHAFRLMKHFFDLLTSAIGDSRTAMMALFRLSHSLRCYIGPISVPFVFPHQICVPLTLFFSHRLATPILNALLFFDLYNYNQSLGGVPPISRVDLGSYVDDEIKSCCILSLSLQAKI